MNKFYYYGTLIGIFIVVWLAIVINLALILEFTSPLPFGYRFGTALAYPQLLLFSIGFTLLSRKWVYHFFSGDDKKKFSNVVAIACMVIATVWFLFNFGARIMLENAEKKVWNYYNTSQSEDDYGSLSTQHESVEDILAEYSEDESVDDDEFNVMGKIDIPKEERNLTELIEAANEEYPMEITTSVTLMELQIEEDYVVYLLSCDENLMDIDLLNNMRDELKSEMEENIDSEDPEMSFFLRTCVNAHKGIEQRYVGDTSGKVCVVRCPYSELKEKITK